MTHRYAFDRLFADIFRQNGIDVAELLRRSQLPEDLFSRHDITLTQAEYFRMLEQLEQMDTSGTLPDKIATTGSLETVIPPVFAAYCSADGLSFLRRFATYKRLAGPVKITLSEHDELVDIMIHACGEEVAIPHFLARIEMAFIVATLSKGTQTEIKPLATTQTAPYVLTLAKRDLERPFVSRNDAMWSYFEPELRRRLSEMEEADSMIERVRCTLVELLPAGKSGIDDVAKRLCLSRRTLQRRLYDEFTTFQQLLNSTRMLLAQSYLRNNNRSSDEIAFLLGYEDTTSFLRAFNFWTGMTITEYKRSLAEPKEEKKKKKK